MNALRFATKTTSNGIVERNFTLGEIPGVLWSPATVPEHPASVLMGHGGGLHKKTPAFVTRAHAAVTTWGFSVVAIDAPGHGDRPRTTEDDRARADLGQAMAAGDSELAGAISVGSGAPRARGAVPEWQATLDALQQLPEIGPAAPIGYGGGITLGTRVRIPPEAGGAPGNAAPF